MKQLIFLTASLLSGCCALAQQPDSVAIQLAGDSAAYAVYRFAQLSPAFIQQGMPQAFNQVKVGVLHTSGGLAATQDASRTQSVQAATDGKVVLGKVHLWGAFAFERTAEDSTRFAHQTRNITAAPFYYGSPGKVHYQRKVYKANAMLLRPFFNNRLPLGAGIDYRIGNHFSVNDPRGNITEFELKMNATAGYTLVKNVTAGVQGYYGYGQEVLSIGYKNPQYRQSPLYPLYQTYVINGYGEPEYQPNDLRYRTARQMRGAGGTLQYKVANSWLALHGKWEKEEQKYRDQNATGFNELAVYDVHTTQLNLLWNRRGPHNGLTAQLQWHQQRGKDFNLKYQANNYRYNAFSYTGALAYTVHSTAATFNYGLRAQYSSQQRIDGIYANHLRYVRASVTPSWGVNFRTAGKLNWGIGVNAVYDKALDHTANISAINVSYFTREVMYHDYYYQTADVAGGGLGIHINHAFDGFNAGIKINASYRRALQWNGREWPQALYPGRDRFMANAALVFFF